MNVTSLSQTAVVVIPGTANYFYNQAGRRVSAALREAGWQVQLTTLAQLDEQGYAWCFLVNISELLYSRRAEGDGLAKLVQLRARCHKLVQVLLECATTAWFEVGCQLGSDANTDGLFDLGLHDQRAEVPVAYQSKYHFVSNGLLAAELQKARQSVSVCARPIPWAVVGHQTPDRLHLVARLIREFDPRGFFYLPLLEPVTEDGPHLNEQQFQRVLERAQYQVWCSHHQGYYLEGERFRASLLSGGLPVKVQLHTTAGQHVHPTPALFDYLVLGEDFPARLKELPFAATRQRFVDDFCRVPGLSESFISACASLAS